MFLVIVQRIEFETKFTDGSCHINRTYLQFLFFKMRNTTSIELTTWFDRLPTEIIFLIFEYLSTNDILYTFLDFNQRLDNLLFSRSGKSIKKINTAASYVPRCHIQVSFPTNDERNHVDSILDKLTIIFKKET